ncbi:FG-GAP-like repeat-containing protein [Thermomonospora cellulosilytica]|uniref:FG-GAP repeat protein n=1 Tax=Thermomonospora cellulosilytica TaxID=1411118 RepID=A0A7W3RCG1_9ACTN|nr:FG-GAP-like repeat-containing protein [Thermomonospora cellulosilytica]MBA9007275.1 hypothetical protein [Thermomonospora cellulosilytica]
MSGSSQRLRAVVMIPGGRSRPRASSGRSFPMAGRRSVMRRRALVTGIAVGLALLIVPGASVSANEAARPGDFNGDGIIDLAIGIPGDTINGHKRAGSIAVALGARSGAPTSARLIHQGLADVPGGAEAGDGFGQVLASADFNRDGYADLAIGIPMEAMETTRAAGGVLVCFGSSGGLATAGCQSIGQGYGGVPGSSETDDHFGSSLAAGDLTGDGFADLVIGSPLEAIETKRAAGSIRIVPGGSSGMNTAATTDLNQDSPVVPGAAETDDRYGEGLAVGDIDGDGQADLVVGVSGELVTGSSDRGGLQVLYGPFRDNKPARAQAIVAPDVVQAGEFLGTALVVADFNGDGPDDIAVGMAEQLVNGDGVAGQVVAFTGDRTGISATRRVIIHQDSPGTAGGTEPEDAFGNALAAGDFDGDGRADLIAGVRGEDLSTSPAAGAAVVFFGHPQSTLSTDGSIWIDQDVDPMPDANNPEDHFGWSVGAADIDGDGRAEAIVGAPKNGPGGIWIINLDGRAITSPTFRDQASLGLGTGQTESFFGQSLM